jgi:hypothetical protein
MQQPETVVNDTPQPPIDLKALRSFLDSLGSTNADLVQHLQSGQKLCHYTTLEGAIGIVTRGDLWLSNARFSNDDEEMNYGHRLLDVVLAELEGEAAFNTPELEFLKNVRACIETTRGQYVYICCFCEQDNLLSQWRGYAENGGGVSIEFDPQSFIAVTGPDSQHGLMRLWKVFYTKEQQQRIIRQCIDYPGWKLGTGDERVRLTVDALQFFLPTFKSSDFREEQERRLVFSPYPGISPRPGFRRRGALLVPYYSLRELSDPSSTGAGMRLGINHVLIGPGPQKMLNVESVRMMLAEYGYTNVPVEASSTPFRG